MDTLPARIDVNTADDRTLAGRAADGDARAFEALVRRHGPIMRAYARRVLGSTSEVDDAVQDTFVTAWQHLPTLSDAGSVKSWLMRILSRKCIDRIRVRKDHANVDDHDQTAPDASGPSQIAEGKSREIAVSAALSRLPEDQRHCWVLKELGEYSYDDIAADMDLPASTVRGLLSRARKNLIREMEAWR
jgi:RNA polymerase sigma-70 factor (ECF subfamily)